MKKIITILLISLSLIGLVGCNKEPEGLNPDRSTNHKYDFINYLKLDTVGPNGAAIIEVKIGDSNVTDFETESDYIAVRKIMEKIVDSIVFDKSENLTNGDIITVYQNLLNWIFILMKMCRSLLYMIQKMFMLIFLKHQHLVQN